MPVYNSKRLVIIESPFAGNRSKKLTVGDHKRYLQLCLRDSLLRGEAPFASHGLYTLPNVLRDTIPEERELGMHAGFQWINVAEYSAAYIDLGISDGMRAGIRRAEILGHDIQYRTILNTKQRKSFGILEKA